MKQSASLHLALNQLDPSSYDGSHAFLRNAETDARAFLKIAHYEGFLSKIALFGAAATRDRFIEEMQRCASTLKAGDYFLLTFSGHGSEVPLRQGDYERNGQNEAICLWDGKLVDDDLRKCFHSFQKGVRVIVVADNCYSGDLLRSGLFFKPFSHHEYTGARGGLSHAPFQKQTLSKVEADMILIAAAEEDQMAANGRRTSPFVEQILAAWNLGKFSGNYVDFVHEINTRLCDRQRVTLNTSDCQNEAFLLSPPFKIL